MTAGDRARHERFLLAAIDAAAAGITKHNGGPFAALIVRDGAVVATGFNAVTSTNDPTAHAEIQAIRAACRALGAFQLDGCDVYSSCEPCPMCLGALYWARPRAVYFAATRADAAAAGFDDAFVYDELARAPAQRALPFTRLDLPDANRPFKEWLALPTRVRY